MIHDTVILVTANGMGKADEKLQLTLIEKYLELLLRSSSLPYALCFYTDGVKLVCEGSPVIPQLKKLETRNVRMIICSTCLTHYDLTDKVQVGLIGGMGDIIEAQFKASHVITI